MFAGDTEQRVRDQVKHASPNTGNSGSFLGNTIETEEIDGAGVAWENMLMASTNEHKKFFMPYRMSHNDIYFYSLLCLIYDFRISIEQG